MMKIDRAALRRKAHIRLEREEADTSYTRELDDQASIAWIKEQLALGNSWAWCDVKVTAHWNFLDAETYLGQCSYESREDFMRCDYYESMVNEAIDELAKKLESLLDDHDIWDHDRVTCIPCASISAS